MKCLSGLTVILVVSVLILSPNIVLSQDSDISHKDISEIFNAANSGMLITKRKTDTQGSAFLNKDFLKGKIFLSRNSETNTVFLRYNMEKNQVQFLRNDEVFAANPNNIDGFEIFGKDINIIFRNGFKTDIDDITPATFLRVIYNGNVKFLALHTAVLHKDLATYGTATKKNKYELYQKYYLVTPDGTFHRIKSAEEDLLKNLPDHIEQTKEYAYSHKLSFNKESDLIKILKHYDEISN